jgi:hypothetical protein
MTTYTDVFNSNTVPPSGMAFQALALTGNVVAVWPYNSSGGVVVAKINDLTATSNWSITMPPASQVGNGEDVLFRNVSGFTVQILRSDGSGLATVNAGTAVYIYVTDNSTSIGSWGVINYGASSSSVSAAALAGYGLVASGSLLNTNVPTTIAVGAPTITAVNLAALVNYTSGSGAVALTTPATLGSGFYCLFHNSSVATVTLTPATGTIDGAASFQVQPGESLILITDGTNFFTVGYGRSTSYQFTQQVINLSAPNLGYTLSATQATAKLLKFTGTSSGNVTIGLPAVANIYYVINSTAASAIALTFTTGSVDSTTGVITGGGLTTILPISSTTSLTVDGTNVYTASVSSVLTNASVGLTDGTVGAPSLNWSNEQSTGFYRPAAGETGVTILGSSVGYYDSNGWQGKLGASATGVTQAQGDNTTKVATDAFVQREAFNIALALAVALG